MYAFGVTGPDPKQSMMCIVGGAVAIFLASSLLLGSPLGPGVIVLAAIRFGINTPRGVGVADQGVFVTQESFWNAKPNRIVNVFGFEPLFAPVAATSSHVQLQLGVERIWLRNKEHQILLAAAPRVGQPRYAQLPGASA